MDRQVILEETKKSIRIITLNRPERHNAFNFELAKALGKALAKAAQETEIRVVVIRGTGKAFSAGGDLKLFHENIASSDEAFRQVSTYLNNAIQEITKMPKPVIAAIQGPAYAAGFGIALACDLLVVSENSKLSPSFMNIALSPNAGTTYFLPRILGPKRAAEAFFRGEVFLAKKAQELGIVQHVWSEANFEMELEKLLEDLNSRPTLSLARVKKLMQSTWTKSLSEQLEIEKEEIAQSSLSEDFKEGVTAFVEKRKPSFTGK